MAWLSPNRCESALETGDHDAGHSFRSSAIRVACHSSSVITIVAISARIRSASPRWLPSNRRGPLHLADPQRRRSRRRARARRTCRRAARTSPGGRATGSVACLSTMPISAIRIVGSSTEEAPEDERVHQPRPESLEQLALPEHDLRLVASAAGYVALALGRRPPFERVRRGGGRGVANSVPLTARATASASAAIERGYRRPSTLSYGSRPRSRGRPRGGRRSPRNRRSRRSRPRCRG